MSASSSIEWTDVTWNPVRGCARVSTGCEHCYAERVAHRFSGAGMPYEGLTTLGKHGPRWSGEARFVEEMLSAPLHWKKPRRVFVNSMSDLFHDDITNEQIAAVFGVMAACPQHTFQVLTKRPQRMASWFRWREHELERNDELMRYEPWRLCENEAWNIIPDLPAIGCMQPWPLPNVWLGVSCEDQKHADERIPTLLDLPAAVRFVSAEPLLQPIDFSRIAQDEIYTINALTGDVSQGPLVDRGCVDKLDWVIVGGESGVSARGCDVQWIRCIVEQCKVASVPCFVKQLGAAPLVYDAKLEWFDGSDFHTGGLRRLGLRDRKGGHIAEFPEDLRVRQFPESRGD